MSNHYFQSGLWAYILIMIGLNACSLNPKVTVPTEVLSVTPAESCTDIARGDAWDVRAQLIENDDTNFLVVYFNPPFEVQHEPTVRLCTGPAVFQGREGNHYYYRLGKLVHSLELGRLTFVIKQRAHVMGTMRDNARTLIMKRKQDSDCLLLIPDENTDWAYRRNYGRSNSSY